ncbi:glycosyltransferase family 2 protein [Actinospongicola halichondriae]|uniref:glycosyltransferase family 2 protein n=1 Tax=Actinospongicola halichondriae TaxID=3236844 RepID=UPI003D4B7DD6
MTPSVSVVVSTYDRPVMARELVSSLLAQDVAGLEVVVVDNGSRPETGRMLAEMAATDGGTALRVERIDDNRGPARARNLGWQVARGDHVLFTDDDCRVGAGWASALSQALAEGHDIVQGATHPDDHDPEPVGPWDRTQRITRWSGLFETCNIGYRRSVLEQVGGFDESFPIPAGEDTDLGLRAVAAGASTAFVADAVAHHVIWRQSYRAHLDDRLRMVHLVRLVKEHPELRALLPMRVFWQRSHGSTLAAVVGVSVAGVVDVRLGAVAAGAWVALKSRRERGTVLTRLQVAGLRAGAGVVEVAAMAASSARERTLLL